jgi:hypothetical protein
LASGDSSPIPVWKDQSPIYYVVKALPLFMVVAVVYTFRRYSPIGQEPHNGREYAHQCSFSFSISAIHDMTCLPCVVDFVVRSARDWRVLEAFTKRTFSGCTATSRSSLKPRADAFQSPAGSFEVHYAFLSLSRTKPNSPCAIVSCHGAS